MVDFEETFHSHRRRNEIAGEGAKVCDKSAHKAIFSHAPLLVLCQVLEREEVVIDFSMCLSYLKKRSLCQKLIGRGKARLSVLVISGFKWECDPPGSAAYDCTMIVKF